LFGYGEPKLEFSERRGEGKREGREGGKREKLVQI
jgi:hypothetical protein